MSDNICEWVESKPRHYETDCHKTFVMTDNSTPKQNGFTTCCYCGNALESILLPDPITEL